MVPAGNKAKCLSSVNHTTKTIHLHTLCDLVPLVQFKKREKDPWRNVTFSEVVGFAFNFTKSNTPP